MRKSPNPSRSRVEGLYYLLIFIVYLLVVFQRGFFFLIDFMITEISHEAWGCIALDIHRTW